MIEFQQIGHVSKRASTGCAPAIQPARGRPEQWPGRPRHLLRMYPGRLRHIARLRGFRNLPAAIAGWRAVPSWHPQTPADQPPRLPGAVAADERDAKYRREIRPEDGPPARA